MSLGLSQSALPAELMRGCRLKQEFRDEGSMLRGGWTLFGAPVVNQGIELDGATQYASRLLAGEMDSPEITIHAEVYPAFAADDGVGHDLFDAVPSLNYRLVKTAPNALTVYLGGAAIISLALAVYQAYWVTNGRNVFSISGVSGTNTLRLNGVNLGTSATAWTPSAVTALDIGRRSNNSQYFPGTFTSLYIGQHTSTLQEHVDIWNNATWNWENLLLCNLQFRMQDFDPVNVQTLDSSGYGNHAQLGDGTLGATNPTQGRGRMEFDGGDYLVVPADASLPAGTYTVLCTCKLVVDGNLNVLWDARLGAGVGLMYVQATDRWIMSSGSLFVDGLGPYATDTQNADEGIRTVVFQGVTMDIDTNIAIFARRDIASFMTGTLFDFKIAPGTLTRTQIFDYHHKMKAVIGGQI